MFCRRCGSEIPDDSLFCPQCGEQTSTSPPQQHPNTSQNNNISIPLPDKEPPPTSKNEVSPPVDEPHTFKQRLLCLFKFSGQISREALLKNLLIALPLFIILYIFAFFFVNVINGIINGIGASHPFILDLLILLFASIPILSIMTRRMRDAGVPLFFLPICLSAMLFLTLAETVYSISGSTAFASYMCGIASYVILCVLIFFVVLPSKNN